MCETWGSYKAGSELPALTRSPESGIRRFCSGLGDRSREATYLCKNRRTRERLYEYLRMYSLAEGHYIITGWHHSNLGEYYHGN